MRLAHVLGNACVVASATATAHMRKAGIMPTTLFGKGHASRMPWHDAMGSSCNAAEDHNEIVAMRLRAGVVVPLR